MIRRFFRFSAITAILLFFATYSLAQGVRWDLGTPGSAGAVTTFGSSGYPQLLAAPNVTLNFCSYPANAVPCTNFTQSYTSLTLGTSCPSNAQIVLQGSSTCQATGDALGNLGVYIAASGTYAYTLTSNGASFGPYTVTIGGSGGGGGGGVTNVTATGPVVSSGGLAPVISMPKSTSLVDGYLSHLDWVSFNNAGIPGGITFGATSLNWSQVLTTTLTAGSASTVTLTPCPVGIDTTSGAGYMVYIGGTNAEAVSVTGGTCTSGATTGTITFTPFSAHSVSYSIGSASSGIQETLNNSCGVSATTFANIQCNVTIPANGPYTSGFVNHSLNDYNVYGTIYLHANQSFIKGDGVTLNCTGRGPCLQVGDLVNSNHYGNNVVRGFSFRSPTDFSANSAYAGVKITNTQTTGGFRIITTGTAHNFRPGDLVNIQFTDNTAYWGDAVVADCGTSGGTAVCTGSSTSFRIAAAGTIASQATPGVVALSYEAILDNGFPTHFVDIQYDSGGEAGAFNHFFDLWDDENATIEHFNTNSINLNGSATWVGSYVYSGGAQNIGHQIAPVITILSSSISGNSNGITVLNSNGLYVSQTVIQSTSLWETLCANETGNLLGCTFKDIYNNGVGPTTNPVSPAKTPFPGLGWAGLIDVTSSGAASTSISGGGGFPGYIQTGGAGAIPYTYYVVAHCIGTGNGLGGGSCKVNPGNISSPLPILNWVSTGSDSIPVKWPRVANGSDAITYDVIRMTTVANIGDSFPSVGNCGGGSGGTCGSVATNISQATACSGGLVCTYTDSGSSTTSAYTINLGNYNGSINFWPGSLVVSGGSTSAPIEVEFEQLGPIVGFGLAGSPIQVAKLCTNSGQASPGGFTTCMASITTPGNSIKNQTATLMTEGPSAGGGATVSKGRLNFIRSPFASLDPQCVITVADSQASLTEATFGYRPLASVNDVCIGLDQPAGSAQNLGQLFFNSPVSISNYIGTIGDNASFLERLTSALKTFAVNVQFNNPIATLSYNDITEIAAPANPAAGKERFYADSSAHTLKCLTSSGGNCNPSGGGSGTVNNALQFSVPYYSAAGTTNTLSGLVAPTTPNNVAQTLISIPAGGVGTAPVFALPGITGRAITGSTATDTILNTDCTNRVEYVGSVAVAVTLPTAITLAVPNCVFKLANELSTANNVTVTPTTWTINGGATLVLARGQVVFVHTDPASATNWQADVFESALTAGAGISLTRAAQGVTISTSGGGALISADYTNATTSLTNVTGLTWPMILAANYTITCNLVYQSSASTAALQLASTTATATKVSYFLNETLTAGGSPTFYSNAADGASFATTLGASSVVTTAADLPAQYIVNIRNATAGPWQLQAKAAGAGTVTIKDSSSCIVTQF